ncbi:hypothetical protein EDD15DRAFT_2369962 [Pisolithus albus]|nr:hypothetical protein EDD15DRAFT_2369962 [Pisolithus albus]
MSNPPNQKVCFYNKVEIMTIEQASQSSGSPQASTDQSPSCLSEDVRVASQPKKMWHSSQSSTLHHRTTVEVEEDDPMDWMDNLESGRPSPQPYIPDTEEDAMDILEDLSQPPPCNASFDVLHRGFRSSGNLDNHSQSAPGDIGDDTDEFDELETGQVPPLPPTPPEADTLTASDDGSNGERPAGMVERESFDMLSLTMVINLAEDKQDWESGFNFACTEQKRIHSKFCNLFNTFFEPVPSHAKQMKMEGLVNPGADEAVFHVVYEMKIRYRHTRLHYEFGFNTHLDRHIMEEMRQIAV